MKRCDLGEYTVGTGNWDCLTCPDGHVCRGFNGPIECNDGFYCTNDRMITCPAGTYHFNTYEDHDLDLTTPLVIDAASSDDVGDCLPCEEGQACLPYANRIEECSAGWYCLGGNETPKPNGGSQNGGMYKPGEYGWIGESDEPGVDSVDDYACDPGFYCSDYAATEPTGLCREGYFCP